jgi:TetR/AcrR family transcriptional repressor of nem operon
MEEAVTQSTPAVKAPSSRAKLIDAALTEIRERGYNATTVDDLCAAAGVTKGAFFHHFKSKEDLAVAAADYWTEMSGELFGQASYHRHADPLDRLFGYIDLRAQLIRGTTAEFTCLAGTMTQEIFQTNPRIRKACFDSIAGHAEQLEDDIAQAIDLYRPDAGFTAKSLALHTQAVLQGAFILAKAKDDPQAVIDSIAHLRRYFELLFDRKSRG